MYTLHIECTKERARGGFKKWFVQFLPIKHARIRQHFLQIKYHTKLSCVTYIKFLV